AHTSDSPLSKPLVAYMCRMLLTHFPSDLIAPTLNKLAKGDGVGSVPSARKSGGLRRHHGGHATIISRTSACSTSSSYWADDDRGHGDDDLCENPLVCQRSLFLEAAKPCAKPLNQNRLRSIIENSS